MLGVSRGAALVALPWVGNAPLAVLGCPWVQFCIAAASQSAFPVRFSPSKAAECTGCWVHQSLQLLATSPPCPADVLRDRDGAMLPV